MSATDYETLREGVAGLAQDLRELSAHSQGAAAALGAAEEVAEAVQTVLKAAPPQLGAASDDAPADGR